MVKSLFSAFQHIGNRKGFLRCVPPFHQGNPFAHHCSFTLHTSYTNVMLDEGGGGDCQKAEKQITVPAHQVTHFHIFCLNTAVLFIYTFCFEHNPINWTGSLATGDSHCCNHTKFSNDMYMHDPNCCRYSCIS